MQILEPYDDNPFWEKSKAMRREREEECPGMDNIICK
jgi:hypothetical protein